MPIGKSGTPKTSRAFTTNIDTRMEVGKYHDGLCIGVT